jgi:hypothetical protein
MEIARSNKRKFAGETGKCKEEAKQLSVDLVTGRPFFQQKIKLSKTMLKQILIKLTYHKNLVLMLKKLRIIIGVISKIEHTCLLKWSFFFLFKIINSNV